MSATNDSYNAHNNEIGSSAYVLLHRMPRDRILGTPVPSQRSSLETNLVHAFLNEYVTVNIK